jgi:hypothetical protein
MGNTSSKLKGDAIPDLTFPPSEPSVASPKPTSPSPQPALAKKTASTTTNPFQSTKNPPFPHEPTTSQPDKHTTPPFSTSNNKPRKQSLAQRWKERKGVPEPRDENGRGIYSGKTMEELVKQGGQQIVDGRMLAANYC